MSKFTQKAIIMTFMELLKKKSLDKITVKDIIEHAEINRNTFYYYFENIYDLLDAVFLEESKEFRRDIQDKDTFYEGYSRAADIFWSNREAVMHIYGSKSRDTLTRYMEGVTQDFVGEFVKRAAEGTKLSDDGIKYITLFYTYAIVGHTMHWIEEGMADYKQSILMTISKSFDKTVGIMIEEYISEHVK